VYAILSYRSSVRGLKLDSIVAHAGESIITSWIERLFKKEIVLTENKKCVDTMTTRKLKFAIFYISLINLGISLETKKIIKRAR